MVRSIQIQGESRTFMHGIQAPFDRNLTPRTNQPVRRSTTRPPVDSPDEAPISIYGYVPSIALGGVGAVVFLLGLIAHLGLFIRVRSTRIFQGLFALGCVSACESTCAVGHA